MNKTNNHMKKLYLAPKFEKIVKNKSLKDFIENYFNNYAPATFKDKNCENKTCATDRRRSASDLLLIYKTYNPEKNHLDILDVIKELPKIKCKVKEGDYLYIERENYGSSKICINIRYCGSPQKVVIFSNNYNFYTTCNTEYGPISILNENYYKEGVDGLSIKDCVEILGIKGW